MELTPLTPHILLGRANARWGEICSGQPDLGPAITLQRSLVARTIGIVDRLGTAKPAMRLDPSQIAGKLRAGTPALRGEIAELPVPLLGPLVVDACDDLAGGGAGDVARRVRDCLEAGRVDIGSLLAASFDRNQTAIRAKAVQEGVAPDVLWLAAELAVGPVAYVTARTLLERDGAGPDPVVAPALAAWPHGYCPACGSWPAFGEEVSGSGHLRCSFCGLDWRPPTAGCTYCDDEPPTLTSVKTTPDSPFRAELCADCGAYLKWLDLPASTPFELLPIEDLASTAVDALAAQQGFGRPTLPDLGPGRLPCEGMPPAP